MRRASWACALTVLALAAVGSPAAPLATAAKPTVRACGLVGRINGRLYDVRETKGSVPCRRVRQVVRRFLITAAIRPAPGWLCFRGHGDVPWAASCARGSRVLVRVYAPT